MSKTMRIGVMLRTAGEKQGIGIYTQNIIDNLLKLDKTNHYTLFYRDKERLDKYSNYSNVTQRIVQMPTKLLWDQVAIPYLAKKEKLDVIFNTKFTVPLLTGCKTIMVLHGSEWFIHPQFYPWWDIQYVKLMMPLYLRRANAVISVSNRAKEDIVTHTGADPDKIRTVYLAPAGHFTVIKDEAQLMKLRQKYALPQRFILFVGKIYPGKNTGNLIRAFSQIRHRIPHKLVMCGGVRWKYDQDLKLIEQLGLQEEVLRIGWIQPEELPAIYNLAELFAFPSIYESCPAPPWEAMACGCPVLTSNTGGTLEVVGDAAILIDPRNVDDIANAMYNVLTDEELRQNLVEKGFEQYKKFSWAKCAKETLEIIERLNSK